MLIKLFNIFNLQFLVFTRPKNPGGVVKTIIVAVILLNLPLAILSTS